MTFFTFSPPLNACLLWVEFEGGGNLGPALGPLLQR